MPLSSGQTFAGYRIVRLLGSGAMGEVYLAEHPRLPRRDALKVLPADVSADPEYRARFNREADLASKLWHPNIVRVNDRGEFNGQLWISMDYVDGLDTARLLTSRYPNGMPTDRVVRIVTAVASALDYAHKQGLLHRDVKPANIMLTHLDGDEDEQRVLLADFGIARTVDDISGLTATNMTVGTVAYAAPEQLMGEEIDGRADQYALAATAYHLLTGAQLFPHSNPAVVISRHLNSPPPAVADMRPDLAALDRALAIALAKNPQDRFSKCTDFARVLASARDQVGDSQQHCEPPFSHGARFTASSEGLVVDDDASPPKPPPGSQARPSAASGEDPTMDADAASPPPRHVDSSRAEPPAGEPTTRQLIRPATLFFIVLALMLIGALIFVGVQLAHNRQSPTPPTAAPNTASTTAAVPPPQTTTTTTMSTATTATTTAPTTSTLSATVDQPCSKTDHDKLAYDPASGQEIACQEIFWPSYGWSWQKAPPTEGVHIRGTACDGLRAYSLSRTADGYLIECMPPAFTSNEIAGPGSVWSRPANQ